MQRDFTVACREDEMDGLVEAAAYLDKQMRAISEGGQVLGIDRCAIMAGLNISHSFLQLQNSVREQEATDAKLQSLHNQIDKCLTGMQRNSGQS